MKKKLPAYAAQMIQREWAGASFGLVVLSLADWDAGKEYAAEDVWRVVAPGDVPLDHLRLEWAQGRDVLIVGNIDRAEQMVRLLLKQGVNSVWVDFGGVIHRVEVLHSGTWVAMSDPVAQAGFRALLDRYTDYQILVKQGMFSGRASDATRAELLAELGLIDEQKRNQE